MKRKTTRIVVCPDTHVPYHDVLAWNTFLAAARAAKPDALVIIGDFADFYAVSSHPKNPSRKANLEDECVAVNRELDALERLEIPRVIFCEGNHEERLTRYLTSRAPELHGALSAREKFRIRARGWEWLPYRRHIKIGKLYFAHDVGPCGKFTAQRTLEAFQHPIVIGHSHRAGIAYGGYVTGERSVCMNVGWLGDVDEIDYVHQSQTRDWVHSWGDIHQDEIGVSWCNVVPIIKGRTVVDGRVVSGRRAA